MSGRIRTIKPELIEDEKSAELADDEFRLFVALFLLADDYGNFRANPAWISSQIWWARKPSRDCRECLAKLSDVSLVTLYRVSGQHYGHINGWRKHQNVDHPGKPRMPGPEQADQEPETPINSPIITKPTKPELGNVRQPRESVATVSCLTSDLRPPTSDLRPPICEVGTSPVDPPEPPKTEPRPDPEHVGKKPRAKKEPKADDDVAVVWGHYRLTLAPKALLTTDRIKLVQKQLSAGFTVEQLCQAIDGNKASSWHQGDNPDGKKYTTIELILRDAEHIESFISKLETEQPAREYTEPHYPTADEYPPEERATFCGPTAEQRASLKAAAAACDAKIQDKRPQQTEMLPL